MFMKINNSSSSASSTFYNDSIQQKGERFCNSFYTEKNGL